MKTSFTYGDIELPRVNSKDVLVPTDCNKIDFSDENKKAIAIGVRDNKTILLVGETGTGKTSVVKELAYLAKAPYFRVSMTGYSTPDELIGHQSVKDGRTYFEYGVIVEAMIRGGYLVLDEINATTPDCTFILHALLDEDRMITLPNGEVIKPHKDFRVFATCNPDYEGTKTMNKAFMDRFPIIIEVGVLSVKKEKTLLVKRTGIAQEIAEKLVTLGTMIRKDYIENKITTFCSTRSLLNLAHFIANGMNEKEAFAVSFAKKTMDKEEQRLLNDLFHAVFKMAVNGQEPDDTPIVITVKEHNELKKKAEEMLETARQALEQRDTAQRTLENEINIGKTVKEQNERLIRGIDTMKEGYESKIAQLETEKAEIMKQIETYKAIDEMLKRASQVQQ